MSGSWTTIAVDGKSVDVYEPGVRTRPRFGILHLHPLGLEMLQDRLAFTRIFEELQLPCLCPHGQRSWWADRVCPEFDARITAERFLLHSVMPYFQARWNLQPRAIGIEGISMGGQGALRLAFKHPDLFPVAAAISAAIDYHELYGQGSPLDEMYDSREQCRQDTALMHIDPHHYPPHLFFCIDPDDERWYRGNDRLHEKLSALGVPHELDLSTRAGGHSWTYFDQMADRVVRFVYAGLEYESRRLL